MSTPPALKVRAASFGYGSRTIVSGIDLTVDPGESLLVLGCNGSGKSTLIKGVLGLCTLMAGEVRIGGYPHKSKRAKSVLGYVPQRHTVASAVPSTVRDIVSGGLVARDGAWPWRARHRAAAVDAALAAVGLTDMSRRRADECSGGQQRRIMIARALVTEPTLLLMDEPTAGVDEESQRALAGTLKALNNAGSTLVIVSHELAPLRTVASRSITLQHGRKVHDGAAFHATHAAENSE